MTQSVTTDELVEDDHRLQSGVPLRRLHPLLIALTPETMSLLCCHMSQQENSQVRRLLSVFPTGSVAPGHLQTQLEAAARTLLPGRVLHLLRTEGQ